MSCVEATVSESFFFTRGSFDLDFFVSGLFWQELRVESGQVESGSKPRVGSGSKKE